MLLPFQIKIINIPVRPLAVYHLFFYTISSQPVGGNMISFYYYYFTSLKATEQHKSSSWKNNNKKGKTFELITATHSLPIPNHCHLANEQLAVSSSGGGGGNGRRQPKKGAGFTGSRNHQGVKVKNANLGCLDLSFLQN